MTADAEMLERPEPAPERPYQDASELAGQPKMEIVYLLALFVAAAADFVAFKQILSLLLSDLTAADIILAVIGVTACALALAHFAGQVFADRRAKYGNHGRWLLPALIAAWGALGLAALAVRLMVAVHTAPPVSGTGHALTEKDRLQGGALLFLILYVASGLLAGVGAYRTHQPLRARYRKAAKDYQKAREQLGPSQALHERAVATLQIQVGNRQREEQNHDAAQKLRQAVANELRAYARIRMAGHLQDPSATTGLTGHPPGD